MQLSIKPADPIDLMRLPYDSESLDRIDCDRVLMHASDLEGALLELSRVLRVGGRMVIAERDGRRVDEGWELLVRGIKRALGKPINARRRTPHGVEEWEDDGYGSGRVIRRIDPHFLVRFLGSNGLDLIDRTSGRFVFEKRRPSTP